jgi:predicted PurR-regulated permease PerM
VARGKAALLVIGGLFVALAVIVIWAVAPIWEDMRELVADLPGYIEELEDTPGFEQLSQNTDVVEKAKQLAADAARAIPEAASALLGITGGLVGTVLSVVTLTFLTLFLLIGLPDLRRSALELLAPAQAAHIESVVDEVTNVISSSLVGNVAISVIAGSVVGVTAWLIGAPFPVALAVIVGIFDLIPQIGSLIAAVIVCLITLAAAGLAPALALAIVILIYQQIENYLVQPAVYRTAISLSGFTTIASVMLGGAVLGVVGAILAVPVAGSVKVIVRELTKPRRERMAAMRAEA